MKQAGVAIDYVLEIDVPFEKIIRAHERPAHPRRVGPYVSRQV